ncbi:MAG: GNAT family N-acetyltransferase [Actinomycetota bacterium]|nr:GNAT family N-acetyltransferase [Actinomycetota bacterium]
MGKGRAHSAADDPQVAGIGRLAVVPDRQGQRLGTRLLAAVEEQLPAIVTELRLFTGEHSAGNLRLYARLGYRESGRQPTPGGYQLVHLAQRRAASG